MTWNSTVSIEEGMLTLRKICKVTIRGEVSVELRLALTI